MGPVHREGKGRGQNLRGRMKSAKHREPYQIMGEGWVWPPTHREKAGGVGGGITNPGKHTRGRELNGQTFVQTASFSLKSILNKSKSFQKI